MKPAALPVEPLPDHVFSLDGDFAVPTELARGPWSVDAQHGSAPAALLARSLERHDVGSATFPVRYTVDLMRPVPLVPLRVAVSTIRSGRKLQIVQGSLFSGEGEVCRATLLRFRESPVDAGGAAEVRPLAPLVRPSGAAATAVLKPPWAVGVGFWDAIEGARSDPRGDPPCPSPMWVRLRVAVVEGEVPTPFQRVAAAADFGNAVGVSFERGRYACINADVTVNLHRLPDGEWVGLEPSAFPSADGFGMSESVLYDDTGRIGLVVQHTLVDEIDR